MAKKKISLDTLSIGKDEGKQELSKPSRLEFAAITWKSNSEIYNKILLKRPILTI